MKKMASLCLCAFFVLAFPAKVNAAELSIPAMSYGGGTFIGYTVQPGDNLYRIGSNYGFDAQTLACINDLDDPRQLSVGQKLLIPTENELAYQTTGSETLAEVAELYGLEPMEIALANDIWDIEALPAGASLTIPGWNALQAVSNMSSRSGGSLFTRPVEGIISSAYGYRHGEFHTGLDIAVAQGTEVKAAMAGTVVSAGWDGNYGYAVVIDHHNGYKTRYARDQASSRCRPDKMSAVVRPVALSGSTGRSTGPHVHWEIIKDGITQNPMEYYR